MRPALVAASLAVVATLLPVQPASAAGAPFFGSMHFDCYGCGYSRMTANVTVTGTTNVGVVIGPAVIDAAISMNPGPECDSTWVATGTVVGVVHLNVAMTVIARTGVMLETGDVNSVGWLHYVVSSPLGLVCGGPVDATVWGSF